jgi:CoA:oxalate CoA-transferase
LSFWRTKLNFPDIETAVRPLEGVTVLDLTTALAGPYATLLLAGLGARVIKIENPLGPDSCRGNAPYLGQFGTSLARKSEDDISISALNRLRNKEAITLNLKHPDAREVFADLVRKADMVVDNFSRGTLDRIGAGYEFGREINPRIIYCSITGFGIQGEPGRGKAMDAIIQALSGVMMTSGSPNDPPVRVGVPFADLNASLFGVIGLLAALHQAGRTGRGQNIDISMLGVMTSMVACEPFDILERCGVAQRTGQTVPRLAPFGVYPTADGFIAICAHTEAFAANLFKEMGLPDLCQDDRFRTRDDRVNNAGELNLLVEQFTKSIDTLAAVSRLDAAGVPAAVVRDPAAAIRDPRVLARGETVRLLHPKYGDLEDLFGTGLPISFSESLTGYDRPAPEVGQHNEAIYGDLLGYSAERIHDLAAKNVI